MKRARLIECVRVLESARLFLDSSVCCTFIRECPFIRRNTVSVTQRPVDISDELFENNEAIPVTNGDSDEEWKAVFVFAGKLLK